MELLFAEVAERLSAIHQSLEKAIAGLPDEALDWSPGPGMNSMGAVMAHTLGAERFWIGDVAGSEPSDRVRDAEFVASGVTVAAYIARSREVLAHSQSVLSRLSLAELNDKRVVSPAGREESVAWAVLHALEHSALHTGHIEITRQQWDQRAKEGR
jgi:uncharacterized damage-inducible protein DinB